LLGLHGTIFVRTIGAADRRRPWAIAGGRVAFVGLSSGCW
jgi:hypothetical protein